MSASFMHVRVRYFHEVHRLYMASASIRFFMKDANAVKDADVDQCKRTLMLHIDGRVEIRKQKSGFFKGL